MRAHRRLLPLLPLLPVLLGSLFAITNAQATPALLAIGTLSGNGSDLSGQTGKLENGVAGNLLGGLGSGLAWAGGNTFISTPDRGPNATAYNPLVDDTASYIARFQTIQMNLVASTGGGLPFTLTPVLTGTTLLSSSTPLVYGTGALGTGTVGGVGYTLGSGAPALNTANNTNYFTGRSDNFDAAAPSTNPNNARLDPEGVRVSADGKSVFISDEYGPYVYQFDRATGQRIKSFALPADLAITNLSAQGATEISGNTVGRVANKGMEGLAITPDGKTLVGIMQASLEQDAANKSSNKIVRIVTIDIATGATKQYAYALTSGSGVSEIVALNDHQFLVDERDGKGLGDGSTAVVKQLFKIDLTGAKEVDSSMSKADLAKNAVPKTLFVDLLKTVTATAGSGITNGNQMPAKIEGLAFGADILFNGELVHTLYVANDNDFLTGAGGDNEFFVFGVSDADLLAINASFVAQSIPEPGTLALISLGLAGLAVRRRSRAD